MAYAKRFPNLSQQPTGVSESRERHRRQRSQRQVWVQMARWQSLVASVEQHRMVEELMVSSVREPATRARISVARR